MKNQKLHILESLEVYKDLKNTNYNLLNNEIELNISHLIFNIGKPRYDTLMNIYIYNDSFETKCFTYLCTNLLNLNNPSAL